MSKKAEEFRIKNKINVVFPFGWGKDVKVEEGALMQDPDTFAESYKDHCVNQGKNGEGMDVVRDFNKAFKKLLKKNDTNAQSKKAKELVNRFSGTIIFNHKKLIQGDTFQAAKNCALICVDYKLNFLAKFQEQFNHDNIEAIRVIYKEVKYWQEVKQEIKKL